MPPARASAAARPVRPVPPARRPGTGLARHAGGADARDPTHTRTRTDTTPAAAHGTHPARKRQVADLHPSLAPPPPPPRPHPRHPPPRKKHRSLPPPPPSPAGPRRPRGLKLNHPEAVALI